MSLLHSEWLEQDLVGWIQNKSPPIIFSLASLGFVGNLSQLFLVNIPFHHIETRQIQYHHDNPLPCTHLFNFGMHFQGTNFCGSAENRRRPLSEFVYNIVMGFVGIFEYLHLKDGPTRLKYIFFYLLISVEAAALMTLWYLDTTSRVNLDN